MPPSHKRASKDDDEEDPGPSSKRSRGPLGELNANVSPRQQQNGSHSTVAREISHTVQSKLGVIQSIRLINFMCHENFEMEFGPNINFIIGQNGSGKSAILTGVVIGLGGRATNTNRGTAAKCFVKKGTQKAVVTIKICNYNGNKEQSYRWKEYGESIIVERTIPLNGSPGYAIKNFAGKTITSQKKDLDRIIRHFSLQIDNPVCILNQEVSRNFLNSKDPAEKYKFFMKATQLEAIQQQYTNCNDDNERANYEFGKKDDLIPQLKNDVEEYKKKIDLLNSLDEIRTELQQTMKILVWRLVSEKESERDEIKHSLDKVRQQHEKGTSGRSKQVALIEKLKEEKRKNSVTFNEILARIEDIQVEESRLREELNILKSARREKVERAKLQESSVATTKRELVDIKRAIEEKQKQNENLHRAIREKEERVKEIERLEDQTKQDEIEKLAKTTVSLFSALKYQLVLREIEAQHRKGMFKHKPIGPLGHYIKLKDDRCGTALEACLKKVAYAFACDNNQDQRLLRSIVNKMLPAYKRPIIITRRFTGVKHNVSNSIIQDDEVKSFLDYITIEDPNVFNVLVDRCSLESIAFIPDFRTARDLLLKVHSVPRNCRQAYTEDCSQLYAATGNSQFRSYPGDSRDTSNLFSTDVNPEISRLREFLRENEPKLDAIKSTGREKQAEADVMNPKVAEIQNLVEELRRRMLSSVRKVQELRRIPDPEPLEISSLEDEYDVSKRKYEQQTLKLCSLQEEVATLNSSVRDKEAEMKGLTDEIGRHNRDKYKIRDEGCQIESKMRREEEFLRDIDSKLNSLQSKMEEYEDSICNIANELDKCTKEAEAASRDRLESRKSSELLRREVAKCKEKLAMREKDVGQRDEILSKYKELKERYDRLSRDSETIGAYINLVQSSIAKRKKWFKDQRNFITTKICKQFQDCLHQLSFDGKMVVHHNAPKELGGEKKKNTLDLFVNPKAQTSSHAYEDTRSLSGGERSFSTVAFLLALWEHSHSPVRILDEVDVFMDMVTRRVAMETLIQVAEEKGTQYLFLSPLPLLDSTMKANIRIQNMPKPKRCKPT
ncbi:Structural maintenance of chromosomes protein 6 [Halotydeus destructor]|nr:Structural maintenance of chromosomes protein 6 [Halotydeus destructor]